MKIIKGNLLDLAEQGHFDVIVHGCNCQHIMGAGIARQIKGRYPKAYESDLRTPKGGGKLGMVSVAKAWTKVDDILTFEVVNAYTQDFWGSDRQNVDYTALRSCFMWVRDLYTGLRIGYPKIGAGLGGGDWNVISKIIDEELEGEDHTLVELP